LACELSASIFWAREIRGTASMGELLSIAILFTLICALHHGTGRGQLTN
jgi:hypothetical protein